MQYLLMCCFDEKKFPFVKILFSPQFDRDAFAFPIYFRQIYRDIASYDPNDKHIHGYFGDKNVLTCP
jgi:hypothetical protein